MTIASLTKFMWVLFPDVNHIFLILVGIFKIPWDVFINHAKRMVILFLGEYFDTRTKDLIQPKEKRRDNNHRNYTHKSTRHAKL